MNLRFDVPRPMERLASMEALDRWEAVHTLPTWGVYKEKFAGDLRARMTLIQIKVCAALAITPSVINTFDVPYLALKVWELGLTSDAPPELQIPGLAPRTAREAIPQPDAQLEEEELKILAAFYDGEPALLEESVYKSLLARGFLANHEDEFGDCYDITGDGRAYVEAHRAGL